jgi:hypothetical protein
MNMTARKEAKASTLNRYQTLMDQMQAFCEWKGYRTIQSFDERSMELFEASWSDSIAPYKRPPFNIRKTTQWKDCPNAELASPQVSTDFVERRWLSSMVRSGPTSMATFGPTW